jgi:hypothetical protein
VKNRGILDIDASTISGNISDFGGGVSTGGTATIRNSLIVGNRARSVGGVWNDDLLTIDNSTISGNTAEEGCGGLDNSLSFFINGTLLISNSTISANLDKSGHSGGLCNLRHVQLDSTLVSGNRANGALEVGNSGTLTADNFNLFGSGGDAGVSGFTPGASDIVPNVATKKILGPLKNNGGPTKTHALVAGSPAIDAVPGADPECGGTDQRGMARPQGFGCDIGAFER